MTALRRSARRWGAALVAVVAAVTVSGCSGPDVGVASSASPTGSSAGAGVGSAPGLEQVAAVVARRTHALMVPDSASRAAAWAESGGTTEVLHRMLALGVTDLTAKACAPVAEAAGSTPSVPRWLVRVTLGYRLAALAEESREAVVDWVLARSPSGWVVVDEKGVEGGPPWAVEGSVVRSAPDQIVVSGLDAATTDAVAADLSAARRTVGAAFGASPPVLLVAPAGLAELGALAGTGSGASAEVGALTVGPDDSAGDRVGVTVYLVPPTTSRLTAAGRLAVITHEVAHVALRAQATGALPGWLEEGLAQELSYADIAVPVRQLADPLVRWLGSHPVPAALPAAAALDPAAADAQAAYLMSWRAVHVLVSRRGMAAVVALARGCAAKGDAGVDCAPQLWAGFGLSPPGLVRAWQADLAALSEVGAGRSAAIRSPPTGRRP